jgi:hypothetical protein
MTLSRRQHNLVAIGDLQKLAPGLYIDDTGSEYFYLTGLYPTIAHRLLKNPLLDTPAFVSGVLRELRYALQERCCMELMD